MEEFFETIRKYNFWDNREIRLGLKREDYLEKLTTFLGNKLIKVITGQRRAGKSYLMRQLIFHLHENGFPPGNILYINKEFTGFDFIKNDRDLDNCIRLYLQKLKPEGKIYLFIDEVQLVESWEKVINSYSQDYTGDFEVFISGSNATVLSGELATLLSGRYITFEVFPYSFKEYSRVTKTKLDKQVFLDFLTHGALPELFHLQDMETKHNYVQDLKNTIVLKDIILRHKIKDAGLFESIFAYLAQNIAKPVSVQNIVNYFKGLKVVTNFNTISSYIEFLKQTYVIHEVSRYDMKGKKMLGGVKKYYLNDLSFRNLLYPGFEPGLGNLLENAVFLEFKRNGYEIFTGTDRNKEVDFVIKRGGIMKYVQVCYLLADDEVIGREFGNLESIRDNYEKMVISLDDIPLGNRNGITHNPAWKTEIYL
jgi:predicted AAA+ superfamily ATPase